MSNANKPPSPVSYVHVDPSFSTSTNTPGNGVTFSNVTGICPRCNSSTWMTGPAGQLLPAGCKCTQPQYTETPLSHWYYPPPPPNTFTFIYPPGSPQLGTYTPGPADEDSAEKALQKAFDETAERELKEAVEEYCEYGEKEVDIEFTVAELAGTVKELQARLAKIEARHLKKKTKKKKNRANKQLVLKG